MASRLLDLKETCGIEPSNYGTLTRIILAVGASTLLFYGYQFASWIHLHFFYVSKLERYRQGRGPYRTWAMVTGASNGIGKEFVFELAAQGFNVVLVARNPNKLTDVVQAVKSKYPKASFLVLVADAAPSRTSADLEYLVYDMVNGPEMNRLPGPLTVLINNVGGNGCLHREYATILEMSPAEVDSVFDLNVRFTMHLTKALLPRMLKAQPALVMNIGSVAGTMPIPYIVPYCGSKAYLANATCAMADEMRMLQKDVEVIWFCVGTTMDTSPAKNFEAGFGTSTASEVAKGCLQKVGCGRSFIVPTFMQAFQYSTTNFMPEWLLRMVLKIAMTNKRVVEDELLSQRAKNN